jgi:hypothetical protein
MVRFCLLFAGVASWKNWTQFLGQETAHFKAKISILTELQVPSYV